MRIDSWTRGAGAAALILAGSACSSEAPVLGSGDGGTGGFMPTTGGGATAGAASSGSGATSSAGVTAGTATGSGATGMPAPLPTVSDDVCADGMALYSDADGDGYGVEPSSMQGMGCDVPDGYALLSGDCDPTDPWLVGGPEAVCGDRYDDNCDTSDDGDPCPETQAAGIDVPTWDCEGAPPANVYASASFPNGSTVEGSNVAPGACVAFFEGAPGLFYAKWYGWGPADAGVAGCTEYDGCICPQGGVLSDNWDRRLYAYTWNGDADCPHITLVDHGNNTGSGGNNEQAVSNECRKYLYALHGEGDAPLITAPDGQPSFDLPFSYVAGDFATLKRRLEQFPVIAIECNEVSGPGVPFAQLARADVQLNAGYVAK